jgi:hypothetical protein
MKKFSLEFSQDQLNVLNQALIELPFRIAAPLIQQINMQIQKQFDEKVDEHDMPTGQTKPKDEFAGD